jgi:hypothetical protein
VQSVLQPVDDCAVPAAPGHRRGCGASREGLPGRSRSGRRGRIGDQTGILSEAGDRSWAWMVYPSASTRLSVLPQARASSPSGGGARRAVSCCAGRHQPREALLPARRHGPPEGDAGRCLSACVHVQTWWAITLHKRNEVREQANPSVSTCKEGCPVNQSIM